MAVCTARQTVHVGAIEVDRAPVTNARYAAFVAATGHRAPAYWERAKCPKSLADHPVVGVDFFDATAFALWAGGALPTEMEWVLASGLKEPRAYVWGDDFDAARCNTVRSKTKGTTPVGSFPPAPSGCVDLCGNVWEMTCNAHPTDGGSILVKGGSWYDFPAHAKLDTQFAARVNRCGNTVGFRLVYGRRMRLPPFLDRDVVARCIAWRSGPATPLADTTGDSGEFEEVVRQLREEARVALPGLEEDSPAVDAQAVDEALELFDGLEFCPEELLCDWEPKAKDAVAGAPTLWERMQTLVVERPLAVLGVALVLMTVLLWSAVSDGDGSARGLRSHYTGDDMPAERSVPVRAAAGREAGARPRRRGPATVKAALEEIGMGTPAQREEAERYLIEHEARASIEQAMAGDLPGPMRASLRYVLTTLAEKEPGPEPRPRVTSSPPREGLVVFFDGMDASISDLISMVRRTAKAERLETTVVFLGNSHARSLARTYRGVFGDVRVYVDHDRTLARLWGATRAPAVAGLQSGGRLGFIHVGRMQRAALAGKVAELKAAES